MTNVSQQLYPVICKYCDNCKSMKCLAGVPWYCCSIYCKYFAEGKTKEPVKCRAPSIKRIMREALVETF